MTFPEYFTETVFWVSFPGAVLRVFQAYASAHIWWNNTVIHPSGIFISGKAQPHYEIQLNSHFCHINGSHFFHHFLFFHCRLLRLHINDTGCGAHRNIYSSRIPTVFKIHFAKETRLTGALCPHQEHLLCLLSKSSNALQRDHWGPQHLSLLSPSIRIYRYIWRDIYTYISYVCMCSSTMAQNNSHVTSKPSTYKGQNAAEMQNLFASSQSKATWENPQQGSAELKFFPVLSSLYPETGCNTAVDLQIIPVSRDKQYSYT